MNIHLPAILMFTRGIGFWPIPIYWNIVFFWGGAFCKTYLHPNLGGCWEGSFWKGVKIPNFTTISGFEGTLHLTYTPVSNFKTSQLPKNKAPLSNFASNLSGSTTQLLTSSHILSHSQKVSLPIFLCEDADFLYCLWIILPFYFVDPPTLEAFEIPGLQARPYHDDELQVPLGRFFIMGGKQ